MAGRSSTSEADATGALFEPGELRDYARFVAASLRRRRMMVVGCVGAMIAAGVAAHAILPPHYVSTAQVLAMPANPAAAAQRKAKDADPEAMSAASVVTRRDHLVELVSRHNLVEHWLSTRPPLAILRDRILGPPSEEDLTAALIAMLEERLSVKTEAGVVAISVDWHDREMAAALAKSSVERFLTHRTSAEVSAAQREVDSVQREVALSEQRAGELARALEAEAGTRRKGARASSVAALQAEGRFRETPDPKLSALREQLIRIRRQVDSLERQRRDRVAALSAQLAEQKVTYGPAHPALVDTSSKLAALEQPGADVQSLRADEQRLLAEFVGGGGKEIELSEEPKAAWPTELREPSATSEVQKVRLAVELDQLSKLRLRLADALADVEATRATVGQRYAVIRPAEVPREAAGPPLPIFVLGGLIAGLALGAMAAVAADLLGGRLLQTWQVRRGLGLRVLAEIPR